MSREQFIFRDERGIWTEEGIRVLKRVQKPLGEMILRYKRLGLGPDEELLGYIAKSLIDELEEPDYNIQLKVIIDICKEEGLNNLQIIGFIMREAMHMLVLKDLKERTILW